MDRKGPLGSQWESCQGLRAHSTERGQRLPAGRCPGTHVQGVWKVVGWEPGHTEEHCDGTSARHWLQVRRHNEPT